MRIYLILLILFANDYFIKAQCFCDPIPASPYTSISVSTVSELNAAIQQANQNQGHMEIILQAGNYQLSSNLPFISGATTALTIRGATGNYEDVIIRGQGALSSNVTHIFNVAADSFTVADLSIGEVYYHPIQIHSNPNDADDCFIQNVRFFDAKEQMLKVSGGGSLLADRGVVQCCLFEFTNQVAYQFYTGGIDAHRSKDWKVRYNTFKHIRSPDAGLAEHAIHFWRESEGTLVEGNHIINCDRGIGFGLGPESASGHTGGLILNNWVHTSRDVGIGLETAPNAQVFHNTLVTDNYSNSIEYRFSGTQDVHIANNLADKSITNRNGGTNNTIESNATLSNYSILVDKANFDYHLLQNVNGISDAGIVLAEVVLDIDCDLRASPPDIGADELGQTTLADVDLNTESIQIFPNPNPGLFTVNGHTASYDLEVLNQQGQVVRVYEGTNGTLAIDLQSLPNGAYILRMQHPTSGQQRVEWLLKQ